MPAERRWPKHSGWLSRLRLGRREDRSSSGAGAGTAGGSAPGSWLCCVYFTEVEHSENTVKELANARCLSCPSAFRSTLTQWQFEMRLGCLRFQACWLVVPNPNPPSWIQHPPQFNRASRRPTSYRKPHTAPHGPTPFPFKTTKKFSPFRFLSFSSPLNNANFHILGTCFNAIYEVPGCLRSRLWPTTQIVGFRTEWRETESDFGARSWVRFFPARRGKGRNDWTYISAVLDSILCLACSGCA